MNADYINEMSRKIHEQNVQVGWWDDPNRCLFECLQLISTEVAEATEGERKDLMDEHLPHRRSGEVELADGMVRTLDLGGKLDLVYIPSGLEVAIPENISIGALHFAINEQIVAVGRQFHIQNMNFELSEKYRDLIEIILHVSEHLGYDIWGAMEEKLEYNKHRPDHKRENRAKANGKKF